MPEKNRTESNIHPRFLLLLMLYTLNKPGADIPPLTIRDRHPPQLRESAIRFKELRLERDEHYPAYLP
jgi:hypothetical protein